MAFVSIINACQAELRLRWTNQNIALTLGFYRADGWTETRLLTLADLLADWWYNRLRQQQGASVSLREVYCRDLTTSSGPAATSLKHTGTIGTQTSNLNMPLNGAYVVSFRTALRGRANRGRNYVPLSSYNYLDNQSNVNLTWAQNVRAAYEALLPGGAYDPTPARWVVLSRQIDHQIIGRAIPITAVVLTDNRTDSQRRRLPGRGL